jgi:ER membrane protein complex subunit 3
MTLLLDPDIRDWVVLPLFVIIVVAGLLRQQVSLYLIGAKTPVPPTAQRVASLLQQVSKIRSATAIHALPTLQWQLRKQHVIELLRETATQIEADHERQLKGHSVNEDGSPSGTAPPAAEDPMEAMMKNPMSMMGGNMVFMVQNMVRPDGKFFPFGLPSNNARHDVSCFAVASNR